MIYFMSEIKSMTQTEQAVGRLAAERPDWLDVLEAAVTVAERSEPYGGEFAGANVVKELASRPGRRRRIPNLRLLVSYGLLRKSGPSSRGGSRAYYRMPDRTGVAAALEALHAGGANGGRRSLSFIAAGASTEPPADMARQAGEIRYEPRSWR
jgi:hypothetical protein